MRSKWILLLAAALLLRPVEGEAAAEGQWKAVVIVNGKGSKEEVQKLLKLDSSLKLRKVYRHAVAGFSISGTASGFEKLRRHPLVRSVSETKVYQTGLNESIRLIGGDQARSYYDLNNQRLTGRGVKVGIIDTGLDYTHPDLKKSYKGGRDLVDGDNDPMETTKPRDQATIHGTHVAGIIAANGKMKGVAPEAELYAYRALGPGGSGDTEQVLAAIDAAIEDHVDVLNLSLGNDINGPDLPISLALNKAVENGIIAVTSNGNSGPDVWSVGSPGTAEKAISVGASTPRMKVLYVNWGMGTRKWAAALMPMQGSLPWKLSASQTVAYGGNGTPEELSRVKGKIALIRRGGITFSEKVKNAEKAGAEGVIIFNNQLGGFNGSIEPGASIPAASITKKEGERLGILAARKKGASVSLKTVIEQDQLADFSSRGPVTVTWKIKPDILAPGVAIDSTIPSGYLSLQGTSMAAPHVAGACALLKQEHPDWTPVQVKSALMSTAKPLENKKGRLYRTYEQGAGRLQIKEALEADTLLYPSSIGFGLFTKKEGIDEHEQTITVENTSGTARRYSFVAPKLEEGLLWDLPKSFTVEPGGKKKVTVGLQVNPSRMKKGIYDGYLILLEGTKRISLPFLYVKEEPDYPRIMGFSFSEGAEKGSCRYEMYLPRGADEFGIVLYDEDTFRYEGLLDHAEHIPQGMVEKEIKAEDLPKPGVYRAIIYARKSGKEDRIEAEIIIK